MWIICSEKEKTMRYNGLIKRTKLTVEEHKELSKELHAILDKLRPLYLDFYNRGYRRGLPEIAHKAYYGVRVLYNKLEETLASENREEFLSEDVYQHPI